MELINLLENFETISNDKVSVLKFMIKTKLREFINLPQPFSIAVQRSPKNVDDKLVGFGVAIFITQDKQKCQVDVELTHDEKIISIIKLTEVDCEALQQQCISQTFPAVLQNNIISRCENKQFLINGNKLLVINLYESPNRSHPMQSSLVESIDDPETANKKGNLAMDNEDENEDWPDRFVRLPEFDGFGLIALLTVRCEYGTNYKEVIYRNDQLDALSFGTRIYGSADGSGWQNLDVENQFKQLRKYIAIRNTDPNFTTASESYGNCYQTESLADTKQ